MKATVPTVLLLVWAILSCAFAGVDARRYSNVTVSGISSGGYMAVQFHVAFSSVVDGSGVVAGGPFYSSQGNVVTALDTMDHPEKIDLGLIRAEIANAAALLSIDHPSNLQGTKTWLFSGTRDTTVVPGVVHKLAQMFQGYGVSVKSRFDLPAAHSFPTATFGNACEYMGPVYINNCNIDTPVEIFKTVYPWMSISARGTMVPSNLIALNQAAYLPVGFMFLDPAVAGLQRIAYAYVPTRCRNGKSCPVHVVFHGCQQTLDHIGTEFVMNTGYNEWAEVLNIIIIYPQAKINTLNPKGCFDWWGFSGTTFATKLGPQMVTTMNMVSAFKSGVMLGANREVVLNQDPALLSITPSLPFGPPVAAAGPESR